MSHMIEDEERGRLVKERDGNRGVDDRDHRASRILRSTSTLFNPCSGFPQRLRNSSMWRAALRMASRSRVIPVTQYNFGNSIVSPDTCGRRQRYDRPWLSRWGEV